MRTPLIAILLFVAGCNSRPGSSDSRDVRRCLKKSFYVLTECGAVCGDVPSGRADACLEQCEDNTKRLDMLCRDIAPAAK